MNHLSWWLSRVPALISPLSAVAIGIMTLALNARLKAQDLRHAERMQKLNQEFTERLKRIDTDLAERTSQVNRDQLERTRQTDLYRTVYPEKFKVAVSLMERAAAIYREVYSYSGTWDHDQPGDLLRETQQVYFAAHSQEWLLGEEVARAASGFHDCARRVVRAVQKADHEKTDTLSEELTQRYDTLIAAVRKECHIDRFDGLFDQAVKQ